MLKSRIPLFAAALLAFAGTVPAATPSDDDFAKAPALIKPGVGEHQWKNIPWLLSVSEGQKKAAAEGKPLLLAKAAQGCVVSCL
jgi:hypothetical protein